MNRMFLPLLWRRLKGWRVLGITGLLAALAPAPSARAQTAPVLVSVTPAEGATGVGATTPLVFVFDQAMDVTVPIFASVPGLVGSFETTPASVGQQMFGTWSDDGRTLTLQPSQVPLGITVNWTLNPPGALSFVQIKSQAGVALATVSGSYSTGAAALALASVSPTNDASGVALDATVVFRFNQPMEKLAAPGGNPPATPGAVTWAGTGLDAARFTYNWSADGRQLFCDYTGGFPTNTLVTWALNPAAAPVKLTSQSGTPLPSDTYTGRFTTAAAPPCEPQVVPEFWGSYSVSKVLKLEQTSAADPQVDPLDQSPFVFSAFILSPTRGPTVTAGSLTLPSGAQTNLSATFGYLQSLEAFDTAAELETAFPPGGYTLRFTQTGQPERVIPMNLPATFAAVPKITNFPEAQGVNAGQDFTLQWNAFSGAAAEDFISLLISDDVGEVVFQAPDSCVPRELPATATSIVIPAGTFQTNRIYNAQLSFGRSFYFSTNTVTEMAGYGSIVRYTRFTVATGTDGGPGPGGPATFAGFRLNPDGNPELELGGTAGRPYGIQRAASVSAASWPEIGTVTMDAGGRAVFEDSEAGKVFPLFYRAVAK